MKLLFDQNISFRIIRRIVRYFPQSMHVSQVGLNNSEDSEIWNYAKENGYVIVTFDSDYFDLSLIRGCPPKVIWLKTGNLITNELAEIIIQNSKTIIDFILLEENKGKSCLEINRLH